MRWKNIFRREKLALWSLPWFGWLFTELIDWWGRAELVVSKAERVAPLLAPVVAFLLSGWGQLALIALGFVGLSLAMREKQAPVPIPTSTATPPPAPKPPTPDEIFRSDFPHLTKFGGDIQFDNGFTQITIPYYVYIDFFAKSKFVGLFIPRVSRPAKPDEPLPPETNVSAGLSDTVLQLLKDMDEKVVTELRQVGGQPMSQKDSVFSGRVFLYHEDYLSPAQQAYLIDLYKEKGFDAQLHGPDYFAFRQLTPRKET